MIDNETLGRQILELSKSNEDYRHLFTKLDKTNLAEQILHYALIGAAFHSAPLKMIVGYSQISTFTLADIQMAFEDVETHGYNPEEIL